MLIVLWYQRLHVHTYSWYENFIVFPIFKKWQCSQWWSWRVLLCVTADRFYICLTILGLSEATSDWEKRLALINGDDVTPSECAIYPQCSKKLLTRHWLTIKFLIVSMSTFHWFLDADAILHFEFHIMWCLEFKPSDVEKANVYNPATLSLPTMGWEKKKGMKYNR